MSTQVAAADTHQNSNGLSVDGTLQAAGVDALRVVAQPVSKVHALHEHGGPLLAPEEGDGRQHVLNVAMSEVVALDLFVPVRSLSLFLYFSLSLSLSLSLFARRGGGPTNLGNGRDVAGPEGGGGRRQEDKRDEEGQEPGAPPAEVEYRHGFAGCVGARCGFAEVSCELLRGGWTWRGFCAFLYVAVMQL